MVPAASAAMNAAEIAVGQEYAYVVRGRGPATRRAGRVQVLEAAAGGQVRVLVLDVPAVQPVGGPLLMAGQEVEVPTRSLRSTWAGWMAAAEGGISPAGAPPAVLDRLPELGPDDALVWHIAEDMVLVLGNINADLLAELGDPLYTLTPGITTATHAALGQAFGSATAVLHAASAIEGLQQRGLVFQVAKDSVPVFRRLPPAMSDGQMLGLLRDGKRFAAVIRWDTLGTGLRSLSSVSGLIYMACVVAGQAPMMRTLTSLGHTLDDLKGMVRDEQLAGLRVARARILKVVGLATELGELTPALAAELPDRQDLEVQLERAVREVARHHRRLQRLPAKAGERLRDLERTWPDVLFALAVYGEAELTLTAAEAVRRHEVAGTDERTAAALEREELRARAERVAIGADLAAEVDRALAAIETAPGGGLFARATKDKVRRLARQVRSELPLLRAPALPPA